MRVEGFRELEQELGKLANVNQRRASGRRALRAAAQPMADLAQSMAPRGLSGMLAPSITVGTRLSKRQAGLHRRMFRGNRAAVEVFVGAGPLSSAHTQEFGTRFHAAQPFMRPAWDQDHRAMIERLKAELWADIQKAVARAERRAARRAVRG